MRKWITSYRQFGHGDDDGLFSGAGWAPPEEKEKILAYLRSCDDLGPGCTAVYDYMADVPTGIEVRLMTDGRWSWTTEQVYQFEKYGIMLDREFTAMVMNIHSDLPGFYSQIRSI